jgi:hypothetical protein
MPNFALRTNGRSKHRPYEAKSDPRNSWDERAATKNKGEQRIPPSQRTRSDALHNQLRRTRLAESRRRGKPRPYEGKC